MFRISRKIVILSGLALMVAAAGCAASKPQLQAPMMKPLDLGPPPSQAPLLKNHFKRDGSGSISEQALRRVLAAPVFLEDKARIGVVQVASKYNPDQDLPLTSVPAEICQSLEDSGLFEVATEISTEWPADSGISGLRELAARYRSEYLLLYRHRFVDRSYLNGWGWLYVTVIGALAVPAHTLEAAGVMEATLFDVKTGTILFTVFERIHDTADENIWYNDRKRRALKENMLAGAVTHLTDQVITKSRLLAAARPKAADEAMAAAPVVIPGPARGTRAPTPPSAEGPSAVADR